LSNTINLFPILADLSLSQHDVKGEGTVTGTVTLIVPAGEPGVTVKLSSSQPEAVVPPELKIPAGARTGTFSISGKGAQAEVTATITAKLENTAKTAQLKIAP
jgi:hypothetical protein